MQIHEKFECETMAVLLSVGAGLTGVGEVIFGGEGHVGDVGLRQACFARPV